MSLVANSRYKLQHEPPPLKKRSSASFATPSAGREISVADFIDSYIIIDDAQDHGDGLGTMPFKLWEAQRELLEAIEGEQRLLILKARQLGITWLVCAYALHLCLFKPNRLVLTFSIGQEEANEMMRRITAMWERLTPELKRTLPALKKSNTEEIGWANGSAIHALPSRKSAGSGYTASLIILDEFAKNENASKLYAAVKPTIDGGGKMIILSTAAGTGNLFHDLVEKAKEGVSRFAFRFLPWQSRPGRDQAWYSSVAADAETMALHKQEYPATPEEAFEASEVDAFIDIALWDSCKDEGLPELSPHEPCILAVDGSESDDSFPLVIISRHPRDPVRFAVRYCHIFTPTAPGVVLDDAPIEAEIRELVSKYAVLQLAYDRAFIGQLIRRLTTQTQNGPPPITVPVEKFNQGNDRLVADKSLYDLITQRRIAWNERSAVGLRQHIANANKKRDAAGHLRIVKRAHQLKVDAAVCVAMGALRAAELIELPAKGFSISYDNRTRSRFN
jgi:phage terminase large subunit-like protein